MLTSLEHIAFLSPNERTTICRVKDELTLPRHERPAAEVLIDISDTLCECIEQLAFARYFSEQYQLRAAAYVPGFTAKRRTIHNLIGTRTNFILSRGYRLALSLGMEHGLDAGIVDTKILANACSDAEQFISNARSKERLLDYEFLGVKIGIAIYDSYLRETMEATVQLCSPRFRKIATEAFIIIRATEKYFQSHDVKMVVLGHCVYNNWKIVSDYAQGRGAQVYVTYNSRALPLHDVNANRGLQTSDHSTYKTDFQRLPLKQQELGRAEGIAMLTRRLGGEVDSGISYMTSSPYAGDSKQVAVETDHSKKTLVMMLHSFFDSPHVYEDMVFPDFLAWVRETLVFFGSGELLGQYEILLKPHPNRFPAEDAIIQSILVDFPFAKLIPPGTSNAAVANMRPTCILTVHGSVAAEFSFQGIPVITCGDNPTSSFGFTFEARNKKEYFELLTSSDTLKVTSAQRVEIGEYMYMQYLKDQSKLAVSYPFERSSRSSRKKGYERIGEFSYGDFKDLLNAKVDTLRAEASSRAVVVCSTDCASD